LLKSLWQAAIVTVFLEILELADNEFPTDWMNWEKVV